MIKDKYQNFTELCKNAIEGVDFRVITNRPKSGHGNGQVLIIAPHGGLIEDATTEIAEEIAGSEFSLYIFEALKETNSDTMHVTSTHFDEPRLIAMLSLAEAVVTIHGLFEEDEEFFMIGGLDADLREKIKDNLVEVGFIFHQNIPHRNFPATNPENICNRGLTGAGVQLEISWLLRQSLVYNPERMRQFAGAVRGAIKSLHESESI